MDSADNLYVGDTSNHTIRKVTPAGVVSTVGGLYQDTNGDSYPDGGFADGTGSDARFNNPTGLAVDSAGNLYVADTYNQRIRRGTPVEIYITQQPVSQTVFEGQTATFKVEASSTLPLTYQWRLNGVNLANATNPVLTLTMTATNQAGDYSVEINSAASSALSAVANLAVLRGAPSLSINGQPQSQTAAPGTSVTLSVSAAGRPPPQYQWRRNGVNIPGAVEAAITLTDVQAVDGGQYSVVVASSSGVITSESADLVVTTSVLPLSDNFADELITGSISGLGSGSNRNATRELGEVNHAGKVGGTSVWYGWWALGDGVVTFSTLGSSFDTLLAVYTGSSLENLTEVASDDDRAGFSNSEVAFQAVGGTFYHIAIDGFGGGTGNIVLSWNLDSTVSGLPIFLAQPLSQTVTNGSTASFTAQVSSRTPARYYWFYNCDLISTTNNPTATNSTLIVPNVRSAQVGRYTVRVINSAFWVVESRPAFLEIGKVAEAISRDKFEDLFFPPDAFSGALPIATKGGPLAGSAPTSAFVSVAAGTLSSQVLNNFGAATQQGESNHCGVIGGSSKWFGLQPTNDGVLLIDTIGSAIDTVLAVYTGTNLFSLSLAACDNNSAPDGVRSQLRLNAQRGTRYSVAIDGVNAAQGVINLNWGLGTPPVLVAQPVTNLTTHLSDNLTLSVSVSSAIPAPDFQWRLNGRNIAGATNSSLSLNNLQSSEAGVYSVVVGNFVGTVTSTIANVAVALPIQVRYELSRNNGHVQFRLLGPASDGTVVETSYDLIHWIPIYTNAIAGLPLNFLDAPAADSARRFYRVMPER